MDVGIGLPNPIPGTTGSRLIEWARAAEERGFSSLATIDRVAYPSYESLVSLSAAAAVTERIGLMTNVLLGPTRNPVLLAKEAASVDQISGGRLTLGLGVGTRADDFEAAGQRFAGRGARWDRALDVMHRAWRGELVEGAGSPVGPTPTNGAGVPILVGGMSEQAIARTVRWGIGWTVGGAPPERGGPFAERVRAAWKDGGRAGMPRIVGLTYYALGPDADRDALAYLGDYYGEGGRGMAAFVPKTAESVRDRLGGFEAYGFDEVVLVPVSADLSQLDRAAEAAHG